MRPNLFSDSQILSCALNLIHWQGSRLPIFDCQTRSYLSSCLLTLSCARTWNRRCSQFLNIIMKRYRLKYTGDVVPLIGVTLLMLTVALIPVALVVLINEIEILEVPNA